MPSILNNTSTPLTGVSIANSFTSSLLSVGRQVHRGSGIGLSSSARQGINGFLSSTQSGFNQLFSLATGPVLSVEGAATQIRGLRASVPQSQISESLREQLVADEAQAQQDAAAAAARELSSRGFIVDTEA